MKTATKERPILFRGPMVKAILEGRKAQTRRIVKPQPSGMYRADYEIHSEPSPYFVIGGKEVRCPHGTTGDRLWVRESFSTWHHGCHWYECTPAGRSKVSCSNCFYRATHRFPDDDQRWVPSIFMPRWASRITLEVTNVRVERVNDISIDDSKAEGVMPLYAHQCADAGHGHDSRRLFERLWNSINGEGSWNLNPWVWVVEFKKVTDSLTVKGVS